MTITFIYEHAKCIIFLNKILKLAFIFVQILNISKINSFKSDEFYGFQYFLKN